MEIHTIKDEEDETKSEAVLNPARKMEIVEEWSDFFVKAGFDETDARTFAEKFIEEKIRKEILETISEEDSKQLGIQTLGDWRMILLHIQREMNKTAAALEVVESNEVYDFSEFFDTKKEDLRRAFYTHWANSTTIKTLCYEII